MTASPATASVPFRIGLFVLLALGIVVRPVLGSVGELHAVEHQAASAGAGIANAHPHPHPHDSAAGHGHGHGHQHDHADARHPAAHAHGDGGGVHDAAVADAGGDAPAQPHASGSHGLMHHADAGCNGAAVLASQRSPELSGPAVMRPMVRWAAAPCRQASSPFRPPIA